MLFGLEKIPHIKRKSSANPVAFLNCINIWLHRMGEKPPVILPGFHHHGKIGQLCRPVVDVQPPQVFLHDAAHCFTGGVAVVLIDPHQHIEQVAEDMPAAHAGIDTPNILRLQSGVFFANFRKLRLYFGLLLRLVQIVFPLNFQGVIGMPLQPQAAQAVLHHIADNPIWSKNLSFFWQIMLVNFFARFNIQISFSF